MIASTSKGNDCGIEGHRVGAADDSLSYTSNDLPEDLGRALSAQGLVGTVPHWRSANATGRHDGLALVDL